MKSVSDERRVESEVEMTKEQRYRRIMARQSGFCWGMKYQPAIWAVRGEAPRGSRPSRLLSARLRRTIHLLSSAERVFAQLALYHPCLFELHEQRMLSPVSTVHPLHGHPRAMGMALSPLLGTVEIAQALRCGHDRIYLADEDGEAYVAPYPYIGDLLLFLGEIGGQPHCVNWTIKSDQRDFSEKKRTSMKSLDAQRRDKDKAELRQQIEREYYQAAGIRTLELSPDSIDLELRFNLNLLFSWHGLPTSFEESLGADFDGQVREAVLSGALVNEVVEKFSSCWGKRHEFLARVYQNIWERNLPVDLFAPILIDSPLSIEPRDALEVYAPLFAEVKL